MHNKEIKYILNLAVHALGIKSHYPQNILPALSSICRTEYYSVLHDLDKLESKYLELTNLNDNQVKQIYRYTVRNLVILQSASVQNVSAVYHKSYIISTSRIDWIRYLAAPSIYTLDYLTMRYLVYRISLAISSQFDIEKEKISYILSEISNMQDAVKRSNYTVYNALK